MKAKCLYSVYLDGILYTPGEVIELSKKQLDAHQGFVELVDELKPAKSTQELPKTETQELPAV